MIKLKDITDSIRKGALGIGIGLGKYHKILNNYNNQLINMKKLKGLILVNNRIDYWLMKIMNINSSLPKHLRKSREQYRDLILKRSRESIYTIDETARQVLNEMGDIK